MMQPREAIDANAGHVARDDAVLTSIASNGDAGEQPSVLLIFGFPRSGTSWFANLLNSHPDVIYRHEFFGRARNKLDNQTFLKLRENAQLSDAEYAAMVRTIVESAPETDRPPFFSKNHCAMPLLARKLLWMSATKVAAARPVYAALGTPKPNDSVLVIKETAWFRHIESIVRGFRACPAVLIVRHPCAVIASHLRGAELGLMRDAAAQELRRRWAANHCHLPYFKERGLVVERIVGLEAIEFLAVRWRFAYDRLREAGDALTRTALVVYEDLVKDQAGVLTDVCLALGLRSLGDGVDTSRFTAATSVTGKDSSSRFYSVYRDGPVDVNQWKSSLSPAQIARVLETVNFDEVSQHWPD